MNSRRKYFTITLVIFPFKFRFYRFTSNDFSFLHGMIRTNMGEWEKFYAIHMIPNVYALDTIVTATKPAETTLNANKKTQGK